MLKPQPSSSQAAAQAEMASSPRAVSATYSYSPAVTPFPAGGSERFLPPFRKTEPEQRTLSKLCGSGIFLLGRGHTGRNLIHVRCSHGTPKEPGYFLTWYRAGSRIPVAVIAYQPARFIRQNRDHLDALRSEKHPRHHDLRSLVKARKLVSSVCVAALHGSQLTMRINHEVSKISAIGV